MSGPRKHQRHPEAAAGVLLAALAGLAAKKLCFGQRFHCLISSPLATMAFLQAMRQAAENPLNISLEGSSFCPVTPIISPVAFQCR